MDKGVKNNHKSHITVSAKAKGERDLVLRPGFNRLTLKQYEQITSVPVIRNYFDVGLLQNVKAPTQKEGATAVPEKTLDKMNKEELTAEAEKRGVELEDGDTKAQILEKLQSVES